MVVAISGASAGIGAAVAQVLRNQGPRLAVCARRLERLEQLSHGVPPAQWLSLRADVSRTSDCEMFIARTLEHFGRIDTLICNAGYGLYKRTHEFTPQEVRDLFATNVFGTSDLIHAAVPAMAKQEPRQGWRGQLMIVSSAAARRAPPFLGPYSATKAAQLSIAEAMRVELRPMQIAVTSVHPIMTRTEFGVAAEQRGPVKLPRGDRMTQSVEHVARRMVAAIRHPRAEVWPHRPTRLALGIATLVPGLVDRVLAKYRDGIEAENR